MAEDRKVSESLPPPQMSRWEAFTTFLRNKERSEFLGRNATNWVKVGIFYVVFYAALSAFFAVTLVIFYQTLDNFEPKLQQGWSAIGTNPGLGFCPMPDEKHIESTLIWFKHGHGGTWGPWAKRMNKFLDDYEEGRQYGQTLTLCDWNQRPNKDQVCSINFKNLGENCTKERNFGYDIGQPCIAIRLNKIYGWMPETYNGTYLPEEMPPELQNKIKYSDPRQNYVWVSCEGENPADRENLGPVSYRPEQGFPSYFFPFRNTPGYLAPVVMIQLMRPTPGVLINIECKAWAANIQHSRFERRGSVHFELLMD